MMACQCAQHFHYANYNLAPTKIILVCASSQLIDTKLIRSADNFQSITHYKANIYTYTMYPVSKIREINIDKSCLVETVILFSVDIS